MKKSRSYGCLKKFTAGLFLFFTFIYVYVSYMTYAKYRSVYIDYVADRYMPAQKHLTGLWPKDLSNLHKFFATDTRRSHHGVSRFHQKYFHTLEITKSDDVSCHFNLHLKGFWGIWPSPLGLEKCESIVRKE